MKSTIKGEVSITIESPAQAVWKALTTPELIKQYFFGTDTISTWKVGGPIFFRGEWQGKKYEDKGTILEIVHNKILKYSYWSSMSGVEDIPENYVDITYALVEKHGETTVTITQENIKDENTKQHSEQNWSKVLGDLKALLEKHPAHSF